MTVDVPDPSPDPDPAPLPVPVPASPSRSRTLAARVVLGAAAAITLMALVLFIGMRRNDAEIAAHRGTATATVLSISALRTGIEFIDGAGAAVRPRDGVLYPGLLTVGQRFMVEYSTADPTVVRVAGRTAAVGNVGLALTAAGTAVIGGGLSWLLRRPLRRRSPSR